MQRLNDMSEEELSEASFVFRKLSEYAAFKRLACQLRRMGMVESASDQEENAACIYSTLPEWAKKEVC